ncbi:metallopeptidase [Lentzea sp. BCCO 10_0856]|uniref:Metallopeptidase n=1 Tax=Lentzea miocenica TaxID=3095431 RepID=A0ABU4SZC5_9PSEU|nr:metallopeptidase [Lentzea sp. BCCO 10_0856]MDX8031267.1 metallopeptidase [Lentzea sp. BCCO 10_0856]
MELLPLRTDFDLRRRGYDRDQVQHYVRGVEEELRLLTADRDAALAHAEALARQLEDARTQNAELHARVDRICRAPIAADALTERLRRMVELAHAEAEEITTRARGAAEQLWANAEQAAGRLRQRAEQLVTELDRRRAEMETEHRELMDRAHRQIDATTRQAERRRRELDEQAALVRQQVESDFGQAMALRRAEAMRALAEQQQRAQARIDALRRQRDGIAEELRAAQALLADVELLLRPLPEEEPVVPVQVVRDDRRTPEPVRS